MRNLNRMPIFATETKRCLTDNAVVIGSTSRL
jgi:hypothetical protein